MNFWESQLAGVIAGGVIGIATTLIAQVFATWRQKEQFSHDREQEIRGRRTAALADLQMLLEGQVTALQDLWGFIKNREVRPHLAIPPEEALKILREKDYRSKLWAINGPVTKAINAYANKIHGLLQELLRNKEIAALIAGKIDTLETKLIADLDQKFRSAAEPLSTALKEIGNLMSVLNDIQVIAPSESPEMAGGRPVF